MPIRFHSIPEKFEEFFSKKLLFFDVLLIPSWYRLETRKPKITSQCPLVLGSYKALICVNLVLRKLKIIHTMTPKNRKNWAFFTNWVYPRQGLHGGHAITISIHDALRVAHFEPIIAPIFDYQAEKIAKQNRYIQMQISTFVFQSAPWIHQIIKFFKTTKRQSIEIVYSNISSPCSIIFDNIKLQNL